MQCVTCKIQVCTFKVNVTILGHRSKIGTFWRCGHLSHTVTQFLFFLVFLFFLFLVVPKILKGLCPHPLLDLCHKHTQTVCVCGGGEGGGGGYSHAQLKIFPVPVWLHSGYGKLILVVISPFFAIFKNVVHSLEPGETPSN